jgi:hypothetical protein
MITEASKNGLVDIVKLILSNDRFDHNTRDCEAIIYA